MTKHPVESAPVGFRVGLVSFETMLEDQVRGRSCSFRDLTKKGQAELRERDAAIRRVAHVLDQVEGAVDQVERVVDAAAFECEGRGVARSRP